MYDCLHLHRYCVAHLNYFCWWSKRHFPTPEHHQLISGNPCKLQAMMKRAANEHKAGKINKVILINLIASSSGLINSCWWKIFLLGRLAMYPVGLRPLSSGLLGLCGGSSGPFTSRSITSRTKRCVSVSIWTAWSWFAARISAPLICKMKRNETWRRWLGSSISSRLRLSLFSNSLPQ